MKPQLNEQYKHIDLNWKRKECSWSERVVIFLFRRTINTVIKSVLSAGFERGYIGGMELHHLAAIVDRRLYPEYSRSTSNNHVTQCGNVTTGGDIAGGDIYKG